MLGLRHPEPSIGSQREVNILKYFCSTQRGGFVRHTGPMWLPHAASPTRGEQSDRTLLRSSRAEGTDLEAIAQSTRALEPDAGDLEWAAKFNALNMTGNSSIRSYSFPKLSQIKKEMRLSAARILKRASLKRNGGNGGAFTLLAS